jgi:hypothetical protein
MKKAFMGIGSIYLIYGIDPPLEGQYIWHDWINSIKQLLIEDSL